tara:strand:+ start:312 stop:452 length:141 start_codon:yes stop_codon:yes gene_type:complete
MVTIKEYGKRYGFFSGKNHIKGSKTFKTKAQAQKYLAEVRRMARWK